MLTMTQHLKEMGFDQATITRLYRHLRSEGIKTSEVQYAEFVTCSDTQDKPGWMRFHLARNGIDDGEILELDMYHFVR